MESHPCRDGCARVSSEFLDFGCRREEALNQWAERMMMIEMIMAAPHESASVEERISGKIQENKQPEGS
jgi:hypothetical protein